MISTQRRLVIKGGLATGVAALWSKDLVFGQEKIVTERAMNTHLVSKEDLDAVSPALAHYSKSALDDGLWKRPELSTRDRSLITVAALIARLQTIEMPAQFALALRNGVKPGELSETITHLAFYAGWANAMAAVSVARSTFKENGVRKDQLPPAKEKLLPLDEDAEAQRVQTVSGNFGGTSPGLVQNTTDLLFRDLWLRPALAPRDRSLITVAALIAAGQVQQVTYHLNRAMDNGLTAEEASEILTHLAFYAGWPNCFSALPFVKDVLEKRRK